MADEHVIDSKPIFDGKVVNLRIDTVQTADGTTYQREVIEHSGAVGMVALDGAGHVYLVRQYRAGAQKPLLELPAGGLEAGELPIDCARRELQEEIGQYPGELIRLGGFYVAASYTTEYITLFLARDLRPSELPGDIDEDISVEKATFNEALELARTNQIEDSKTLIGLTWAAQFMDQQGAQD